MKRHCVSVGEIVLIPVEHEFVPAKVLFLSDYFKDVILLGLYPMRISSLEMPSMLPDKFRHLVYTSQAIILKQRWHSVGIESIRPSEKDLSKRVAGGEVWDEDRHLGRATKDQIQSLPQMRILGAERVEALASGIL